MFRFHLVKDRPFQLPWRLGQVHITDSNMLTRKVKHEEVEIESTAANDDHLCVQLKDLMEIQERRIWNTWGQSDLEGKLKWTLTTEFGIDPKCLTARNYIRVYGKKNGNILTALEGVMDRYRLQMTVHIEVRNFGVSENQRRNRTILRTEEVGIRELSKDQNEDGGAKLFTLSEESWDRSQWDHRKSSFTFYGDITITCMVFRSAGANLFDNLSGPEAEEKPYFVSKMLKDGRHSDATIIASDGEEIKCHKIMLQGPSDVFEAMFNPASKSLESTTGVIRMEDMCSKSVKALLAYLYIDDLEDAKRDSAVALDLLKAAQKYNIPRLEELMTKLFLEKPDKWFDVEVALQLFIFARRIPFGYTLMKRASEALKADHSSLWDSPTYKQLFKEEPEAAMKLSQYLMSGGPDLVISFIEGDEDEDISSESED